MLYSPPMAGLLARLSSRTPLLSDSATGTWFQYAAVNSSTLTHDQPKIGVSSDKVVLSWNDFFQPLIYLSSTPDLQTVAVGLARFSGARVASDPGLIQAGTLMTLAIPVLLFLVFQRFFVRGIVITGVEK